MSKRIQSTTISRRFLLVLLTQFLLVCVSAQTNRIDSSRLSEYDPATIGNDTVIMAPPEVVEEITIDSTIVEDEGIVIEPVHEQFTDNSVRDEQVYARRVLSYSRKAAQKKEKDYWYADYDFTKKKKEKPRDWSWLNADFVQNILWFIIIAGFAVVLILYLKNNNISLFRKSKSIRTDDSLAGDEHQDIFNIDYDAAIRNAATTGNFRLATRLHFLRLLKVMADRQVISYKADSTNTDYLMQLAGGPHYKDFFKLARAYEYVWYGEFDLDSSTYEVVRSEYEDLTRKIAQQ